MMRDIRKAAAIALAAAALILPSLSGAAGAQDIDASKRVLVYGDSNAWGWVPTEDGFPAVRLPDGERFAGVLEATLGEGYEVIVDGLSNRTANLGDPQDWGNMLARAFNGAAGLPRAIARALPLDLVVVTLGTNDTKALFDRSAEEIGEVAIGLARIVASSTGVATAYLAPKVLIVSPPPIGSMNHDGIARLYAGGDVKSARFTRAFAAAADAAGVPIFAAEEAMGTSDGFDGVHFSIEDYRQLGERLAPVVAKLTD